MQGLDDVISEKRNSLKTDRLDMSFGELMGLYENKELIISPEYQRAFRWSIFQQTRFIESILLGIPIPPIFVAEDSNSIWELVDGLQRISTIVSFFGLLEDLPIKNNLTLSEGEIVRELDGLSLKNISVKLKTTIKRAVCRVEIVRWDSKNDMRYELFNRLNTGASPLSDQEIRNCIFRAYKVNLNNVLAEIAAMPIFIELIDPSSNKKDQMFLEELVLRYFAFKNFNGEFKKTVPQFLTEFMHDVSVGKIKFDLDLEKSNLIEFVTFLSGAYGKDVFRPNKGLFAQHIYDSLAYAIPKKFPSIVGYEKRIKKAIDALLTDTEYFSIGTSTFSNSRIKTRMNRAWEIFENA